MERNVAKIVNTSDLRRYRADRVEPLAITATVSASAKHGLRVDVHLERVHAPPRLRKS
jgi:hypothetical protein